MVSRFTIQTVTQELRDLATVLADWGAPAAVVTLYILCKSRPRGSSAARGLAKFPRGNSWCNTRWLSLIPKSPPAASLQTYVVAELRSGGIQRSHCKVIGMASTAESNVARWVVADAR